MNTYIVKHYIVEEYEVEAKTRNDALNNTENPFNIKIIRETCVKKRIRKEDENVL